MSKNEAGMLGSLEHRELMVKAVLVMQRMPEVARETQAFHDAERLGTHASQLM